MITTVPLQSLTDDDAARIARTIAQPEWLRDKNPSFKMHEDELYAIWVDGSAAWTGEDWRITARGC